MIMSSLLLFPVPRSCAFPRWSLVLPALQGSPCCIVLGNNRCVSCLLYSFCYLPVPYPRFRRFASPASTILF
jgi:hypothetical protein